MAALQKMFADAGLRVAHNRQCIALDLSFCRSTLVALIAACPVLKFHEVSHCRSRMLAAVPARCIIMCQPSACMLQTRLEFGRHEDMGKMDTHGHVSCKSHVLLAVFSWFMFSSRLCAWHAGSILQADTGTAHRQVAPRPRNVKVAAEGVILLCPTSKAGDNLFMLLLDRQGHDCFCPLHLPHWL